MNAPVHFESYAHPQPLALLFARENDDSPYGSTELDPERVTEWGLVHRRITALARERAKHERELCRWLLAAARLAVHVRAGYASLREYADRVVGLSGRKAEERLRVGRALVELPLLDAALAHGELCWSAVRELTRLATPETEQAWLDWAKGKRSREIERAVAARLPGERPDDRADPSLLKHRLRFEVRADTMALFRDLEAAVRADLGGDVDDDTLLYEIARRAHGGPGDEGRASYQIAVTRCDDCGLASIDAAGESHPIDDVALEMAACDAQHIGHVSSAPPASPHVGAPAPNSSANKRRARQTIPPAIRRAVLRRDRGRCVVPGCRNHRFVDVHHCDPLSEGGSHHPDRLITLCGAHHRQAHAGRLCIDGNASAGFTFRHADGAPYGRRLEPPKLDVAEQAFSALTHMGFKSAEARALVDAVLRSDPPQDAAAFLRAALRNTGR